MMRIRELLDLHPEIWQRAGNPSAVVEKSWIAILAKNDPLAVECMTRTIARMKFEMAGASPSGLEPMLADQAVHCWLELSYLQTISATADRGSHELAAVRIRELESAQKRYLAVVKALNDVRASASSGPNAPHPTRLRDLEREVL